MNKAWFARYQTRNVASSTPCENWNGGALLQKMWREKSFYQSINIELLRGNEAAGFYENGTRNLTPVVLPFFRSIFHPVHFDFSLCLQRARLGQWEREAMEFWTKMIPSLGFARRGVLLSLSKEDRLESVHSSSELKTRGIVSLLEMTVESSSSYKFLQNFRIAEISWAFRYVVALSRKRAKLCVWKLWKFFTSLTWDRESQWIS